MQSAKCRSGLVSPDPLVLFCIFCVGARCRVPTHVHIYIGPTSVLPPVSPRSSLSLVMARTIHTLLRRLADKRPAFHGAKRLTKMSKKKVQVLIVMFIILKIMSNVDAIAPRARRALRAARASRIVVISALPRFARVARTRGGQMVDPRGRREDLILSRLC